MRVKAAAGAEEVPADRGAAPEDVNRADRAVVLTTAGQSFSWLSPLTFFAPHVMGTGPQSVPVNRTSADAKVADLATSGQWSLAVTYGGTRKTFSLADLRALPQFDQELPIACVEGWSQMARWRGVRIRDLVSAVGAPPHSALRVTSLEPEGPYRLMSMPPEYVEDERTLVALELNGSVLDIEHGYPARIIAPGRPGVLQTKWLQTVEVL